MARNMFFWNGVVTGFILSQKYTGRRYVRCMHATRQLLTVHTDGTRSEESEQKSGDLGRRGARGAQVEGPEDDQACEVTRRVYAYPLGPRKKKPVPPPPSEG